MHFQQAKNWLTYFAVRLAVCLIQSFPLRYCQWFSHLMAMIASRVLGIRRQVIDDNLAHAFPDLTPAERHKIARDMWVHLCLMVCEIAQTARRIHRTNWRQYIELDRDRELIMLLLQDRPAILVSGHFGNFELAGYIAGLYGFSNYTIARPLDNPYLDRFISSFRRLNGQFILPKQGSAADVQAILDRGDTLVLLGDQYGGPRGCWVDFLGRPASCHKAIALFALTNQAPLATCYARRLGSPLRFKIGPAHIYDPTADSSVPPEIHAVTQKYHETLESMVRSHPSQYWWVHRRWKGCPPQLPSQPAT